MHEINVADTDADYVACLDDILKRMGNADKIIGEAVKQALELSRSRGTYLANDGQEGLSPSTRTSSSDKLRNMSLLVEVENQSQEM